MANYTGYKEPLNLPENKLALEINVIHNLPPHRHIVYNSENTLLHRSLVCSWVCAMPLDI